MMIPVRCFSCGKPVAHLWEESKDRAAKGEDKKKIMDELNSKLKVPPTIEIKPTPGPEISPPPAPEPAPAPAPATTPAPTVEEKPVPAPAPQEPAKPNP